jgi:hypothetical protein
MGNTSNQSKQRWNAAHYTQVKISVDPQTASAFKAACICGGVSMAKVLGAYMSQYSSSLKKTGRTPNYDSKRQRRAAVKSITRQLGLIKEAEEQCRDNMPESLHGSVNYENAEQCVSSLEEIIELLESAY